MKRVIKFRVWHEGEMVEDIVLGKQYPFLWDDWEGAIAKGLVMQYTGLKDIKGKEIYEGDILKYRNGRLSNPIEFPKDYMWLSARIEEDTPAMAVEVIGNLYENPDLLKRD
jgi:hypothetical protein